MLAVNGSRLAAYQSDPTLNVPRTLASPEEWMDSASCAQVDLDLFFPEKGGSASAAKSVCARCDVRPECLAYALARTELYGIWGGTSEHDRRRLRRAGAA